MLTDQLQREFIPLVARLYTAAGTIAALAAEGGPIDPAAVQELVRQRQALDKYFERAGKAIAKTPLPVHHDGASRWPLKP